MLVCLAATGRAADKVESLDIRPGMWEIALTVESRGLPPIPPEVRGKLTAEQRAQMDAKAREKAAEGPRTTIKKSCLSEKERARPFLPMFGGERQGCKQTVVNSSATRQEIRVECGKDSAQGGGKVLIEVLDSKNLVVSSEWSATDGERSLKVNSTAKLKWLSPLCEGGEEQAAAKPESDGDSVYYYKLGKQQADRNNLWEALRSLTRAIELDPKNALAYNARGYVYLRMRNYANAIVEFSEAIRLRPGYGNAYRNRAIARKHAGDASGAAADEQRADELEKKQPVK